MKTLTNLSRTLGLFATLTGSAGLAAQTQAPFPTGSLLPPSQIAAVGAHAKAGRFGDAMRTMLNSAGDSIVLELGIKASVAIGAGVNVGGGRKVQVEVRRTATGYEVAMSAEDAATLGFEIYEGLEANVGSARGRKVVFRFDSAETVATGLELMAFGNGVLGNARLLAEKLLADARQMLGRAEDVCRDALRAVELGRSSEQAMRRAYDTALAAFDAAGRGLSSARVALASARGKLRDAEKKVEKAWILSGALKAALAVAEKAVDSASRVLGRAQATYDQAKGRMESTRSAWNAAAAELRRRIDAQANAERNRDLAAGNQRSAERTSAALSFPFDRLASHLGSVEFEMATTADLSAKLGIPGVDLANLGLGASLNGRSAARIRWEFAHGAAPAKLTLTGRIEYGLEAKGGFYHLGGQVAGKAELGIHASFVKPGNVRSFRFDDVRTTLVLDGAAKAVAGMGVAVSRGVGRSIEVEMNGEQWRTALAAGRDFAQDPSFAALTGMLSGIGATTKVQDRQIGGVEAGFGFSVAGYGLSVGASAVWNDNGEAWQQVVDAGRVVRYAIGQ